MYPMWEIKQKRAILQGQAGPLRGHALSRGCVFSGRFSRGCAFARSISGYWLGPRCWCCVLTWRLSIMFCFVFSNCFKIIGKLQEVARRVPRIFFPNVVAKKLLTWYLITLKYSWCLFSTNPDVLCHTPNTTIKMRELTLSPSTIKCPDAIQVSPVFSIMPFMAKGPCPGLLIKLIVVSLSFPSIWNSFCLSEDYGPILL